VCDYIFRLNEISDFPDVIYKEVTNNDTFWIIKYYSLNKVTVKLNIYLRNDYKNLVIQMQFMPDKEVKRNLKNGKIKKILINVTFKYIIFLRRDGKFRSVHTPIW